MGALLADLDLFVDPVVGIFRLLVTGCDQVVDTFIEVVDSDVLDKVYGELQGLRALQSRHIVEEQYQHFERGLFSLLRGEPLLEHGYGLIVD